MKRIRNNITEEKRLQEKIKRSERYYLAVTRKKLMNCPTMDSLYKAAKTISESVHNKNKLPQQPIYTFNPNDTTINNSVLISDIFLEQHNGVECRSWKKKYCW